MDNLYDLGDQVDDAITEILVLWPKLPDALERDAGTSEHERVTASTDTGTSPVNEDVHNAIRLLTAEAWPAAHRARAFLGEPGHNAPVPDVIDSIGVLYRRLVGRGLNGEARRLATTVFRWHRAVRTAIGLSRRPVPLRGDTGEVTCPRHDVPLVVLRQRGDEGRLDEHAHGDREAITWRSGAGLYCPWSECDGAWGPSEYLWLGRLVAEQRARLARKESA